MGAAVARALRKSREPDFELEVRPYIGGANCSCIVGFCPLPLESLVTCNK